MSGAIDMRRPVETDEDEPRPVTKDPFDWPSGQRLYMGMFPKRKPDPFTHQSALWGSAGNAIREGVPNLRNRDSRHD